jgi:magnesium and cobalt transporter
MNRPAARRRGFDPAGWPRRLLRLFSGAIPDREALVGVLRDAAARNLFDADVLVMLEGALHVSDLQARDIMVPRVRMEVIGADLELAEIARTIIESGHSRYPVVGKDVDEVVGILLAKDLLGWLNPERGAFDIKDVMRPAVFIPESKRLNMLLREFRASRNHMAIVVDEYGVAGLVTIEDVIEEIVGEIADEHDLDEEENIRQHGGNRYTVRGSTPIAEFNEYFRAALSDSEYDTVGGLIINALGHLPVRGETATVSGFNVKVLRADQRRVHLLRFERTDTGSRDD